MRPAASSSITIVIRRPLIWCMTTWPRAMRWTAFQSVVMADASSASLPDLREDNRLGRSGHARHLAAHGQKEPALLFVVVTRVAIASVDVALIAAHGKFVGRSNFVRYDYAAIIDPAIPALGDAEVHLEFEVGRLAAAPDDKGVALDDGLGLDLAHHRAVLDAPVSGVAFPTMQRLAVEDLLEAGLFARERFGAVALLGHVLLPGARARDQGAEEVAAVRHVCLPL